ncbi:hypothetical protein [Rhodococcoides yunnanense]|uniref:Uncharacterized protein n=1 Tax=Rhodococcoides yunnanense TaxID=278209 RepID=A0ABU4BIE4_9NOCA|nr:hypothetical protein [Rhodococcus yunnanensis]MDV6263980.1 hypothetical protein [Rhodococcus yunnanensis]
MTIGCRLREYAAGRIDGGTASERGVVDHDGTAFRLLVVVRAGGASEFIMFVPFEHTAGCPQNQD